jgi:hypothetical protein
LDEHGVDLLPANRLSRKLPAQTMKQRIDTPFRPGVISAQRNANFSGEPAGALDISRSGQLSQAGKQDLNQSIVASGGRNSRT